MATYAELLKQYKAKHGSLVKPNQGWDSLHPNLWLAYSMVRKRGYYDVGTYVNKPLDHSWGDRHSEPGMALAFDARRKGWVNWIGWGRRNAWKLANLLWDNHEALNINYVIVGNRIISRAKPYWHYYGPDKSHYWHIHVSGWVKP